ncbi:hypothetical protein GCM10025787_02840 [Saccharopolyspora rosea]
MGRGTLPGRDAERGPVRAQWTNRRIPPRAAALPDALTTPIPSSLADLGGTQVFLREDGARRRAHTTCMWGYWRVADRHRPAGTNRPAGAGRRRGGADSSGGPDREPGAFVVRTRRAGPAVSRPAG